MTAMYSRPSYPRKDYTLNLFDYLDTRLETFDEAPLTPVDSAALSQFCMVRGEGIIPAARNRANGLVDRLHALVTRPAHFSDLHRAENYDGLFCGLAPGDVRRELAALAASPRFRDLELRDYASVFDEKSNTQFAAITFVWRSPTATSNNFAYIGFRGTDDSFTGWRENFEMAVDPPVPAQRLAAEYLVSVARHLPRRLYVGGHSKGGNLAAYAAACCPVALSGAVERVYSNDGPGMDRTVLPVSCHDVMGERYVRIVPAYSVVGRLFSDDAPCQVVRSSATRSLQHDPLTWQVGPAGFLEAEGPDPECLVVDRAFAAWLDRLAPDDRRKLTEELFDALAAGGAETFEDLFSSASAAQKVLAALRDVDSRTYDMMWGLVGELLGAGAAATREAVVRGASAAAADVARRVTERFGAPGAPDAS